MSGAPGQPPPSGAPAGPGPSGAPPAPAIDTKIEKLPKPMATAGAQDPAGIVRVYVLEDGSVKPATITGNAGKPMTIFINNYGASAAEVEISGGEAPQKITVGPNEKNGLVIKSPTAGDWKIKVGANAATMTVK